MKKLDKVALEDLFKGIIALETVEECENFFNDICTMTELEAIAQRYDVAQQLIDGRVYKEISESTGASTATVCRVNRCIKYGNGGYRTVIDRVRGKESE